jgi:transposase, IS5 family
MGAEKLGALIQESLAVALRTKAAKPADFTKVAIDTTVQPKAVMFPTDARLAQRAREILVRMAEKADIKLRQSYVRVGKRALLMHQRYAHARQYKRARKCLRTLRTYLGRVMRDIARKTEGDPQLQERFARILELSGRLMIQKKRQDRPKIYSLHAPEVECIAKGKVHRPYEFGVKASVAATLNPIVSGPCAGGQFITHACALPGRPEACPVAERGWPHARTGHPGEGGHHQADP